MLQADHLRKQFSTVLAVDDVSLKVDRGGIFGLIGPNGAGKSTTIRMLLNIITPDTGTVLYDGKPFSDGIRNAIGYLPEERGLYRKNGLLDTIVYFASLRGINYSDAKKQGMEWLERFELQKYAKRKVEELSKGNQQKAQFITTILHDPDIVILDEPFSGLDPVNQIVMKNVLQEMKQKGKMVIFSTHQMDSAEKLCDEICLINKGNIVLEGSIKDVKQRFGTNSIHVEYDGDGQFISSLPFVTKPNVFENYAEFVLKEKTSSREIVEAISKKVDLRKFEFVEPSLNSIFLDVVGVSPQEVERETSKPQQRSVPEKKLVSKHPKVRRALVTVAIAAIVTIVLSVRALKSQNPDWVNIGIFAAVLVFGLYRFFVEKKKAEEEYRREAEGGGQ